ncbi:MAG: hypothetical protein H7239_05605 [Flavobacterium sp.]|nr:hypothetical protein [Flavobacterium sp.]
MKRYILNMTFLLFVLIVNAQMYVSNNSYVFNKGTLVYVKGAMEFNGENNF